MIDSTLSAAIAVCQTLSDVLLLAAPIFIVVGAIRVPRTALYVTSETLVLFTIVYGIRYFRSSGKFFSLDRFYEDAHLFTLFYAAILVIFIQGKARLQTLPPSQPDTTEKLISIDDTTEAGEKTQGALTRGDAEMEQAAASEDQRKLKHIRFNWSHFRSLVFWAVFPTLYSGDHSLLTRTVKWYSGKPNAPLSEDLGHILSFFAILLENNAIMVMYCRVMIFRMARKVGPPADVERAGVDKAEWKQKMKAPMSIWGFIWATAGSAVLLLPSLIERARAAKKPDEDLIYRLVGCSMQCFLFLSFVVLHKWAKKRDTKKAEAEQLEASLIEV